MRRAVKWTPASAGKLVDAICSTYEDQTGFNCIEGLNLPGQSDVLDILRQLRVLLFPGFVDRTTFTHANTRFVVGDILNSVQTQLVDQIEKAYRYQCPLHGTAECDACNCHKRAEAVTWQLLKQLPAIRQHLKEDVRAAYDGDPAATSLDEVIISYPCIEAIATYRIAHELYVEHVPLIPRLMAEHAHGHTGIDIHPGATIGKRFFIDHGTGVVIGETTQIGDNVKIYQGVTLGAMSFPKDKDGRVIKGGKRHPTIQDNVTIYAQATILGGDVVIGHDSVIGGNVWLTKSVPPGTTVSTSKAELIYLQGSRRLRAGDAALLARRTGRTRGTARAACNARSKRTRRKAPSASS